MKRTAAIALFANCVLMLDGSLMAQTVAWTSELNLGLEDRV